MTTYFIKESINFIFKFATSGNYNIIWMEPNQTHFELKPTFLKKTEAKPNRNKKKSIPHLPIGFISVEFDVTAVVGILTLCVLYIFIEAYCVRQ